MRQAAPESPLWRRLTSSYLSSHGGERLGATLEKVASLPHYRQALSKLGTEAVIMKPDAAAAYVKREHTKWAEVAKAANVNLQ